MRFIETDNSGNNKLESAFFERAMRRSMRFCIWKNSQIFGRIIFVISVYVMHLLAKFKAASKHFLRRLSVSSSVRKPSLKSLPCPYLRETRNRHAMNVIIERYYGKWSGSFFV